MRTKNAMQLKARIRNKAKEAGIPPQALMQDYLFERLLVRLSTSKWRPNIVVKGGMLISSLVGVASRTTMDLDTTVCGFTLTHASAESVSGKSPHCRHMTTGDSSSIAPRTSVRRMTIPVFAFTSRRSIHLWRYRSR